jgi:hypothetical protein
MPVENVLADMSAMFVALPLPACLNNNLDVNVQASVAASAAARL